MAIFIICVLRATYLLELMGLHLYDECLIIIILFLNDDMSRIFPFLVHDFILFNIIICLLYHIDNSNFQLSSFYKSSNPSCSLYIFCFIF